MINRLLVAMLMFFLVGTIYLSVKMNRRLDESFKDAETMVSQTSWTCDSLAKANDSLTSIVQEDRITIGRYEYMIELVRQNMDSNKVDKILQNVE
jgi:hypothetical protein